MARAELGLFHQGNNFSQSLSRGLSHIKNRVGQHQPDLSQIEIKWGKLPFRVVAAITVAYLGLYACNPFKSYDAHAAKAERTPISLKSRSTPTPTIDANVITDTNCLQITPEQVGDYLPEGAVAVVDLNTNGQPFFVSSAHDVRSALNTDPGLEVIGCWIPNGIFDKSNQGMITGAKLRIQNLQKATNSP